LPKVSIIIPNYNHAKFLQQRLDTVFNQTFQNFEVILLDDASTDSSKEILNAYKNHPKVSQIIINNENSGSPFKQWKRGIELAKGDYIWIAESDDYCELTFLETLLALFVEDSEVLVYSASTIINDEGKNMGRHKWADGLDVKRWTQDFFNNGKNEIKQYLRYRNTITNASAVVFKKDAVKDIHYPLDMKFCGDWYIWIEILKQGNVAYTYKELNYFRRHSASTRPVKTFEIEKQRINEYLEIVLANSQFFSRFLNRNKYLWILNEWQEKKKNFPKTKLEHLGLSIDFLYFFKLKQKK